MKNLGAESRVPQRRNCSGTHPGRQALGGVRAEFPGPDTTSGAGFCTPGSGPKVAEKASELEVCRWVEGPHRSSPHRLVANRNWLLTGDFRHQVHSPTQIPPMPWFCDPGVRHDLGEGVPKVTDTVFIPLAV